jgi:hypothetical protein
MQAMHLQTCSSLLMAWVAMKQVNSLAQQLLQQLRQQPLHLWELMKF